jgi:hypothetical protein
MMRPLLAALVLWGCATTSWADAGWFEPGDVALRNDLLLLNDAEIIRLPMTQWPLPRAAVRYALSNAKEHFATSNAVSAALTRVRARLDAATRGMSLRASLSGGEAASLRDFDSLGRERGELGVGATFSTGDRAEVSVRITAAADPQDDRSLRADGSHATIQLGNWLVSANALDRWWGPGHDGSLILSSNARPMPTLMVERAEARGFDSRWLSWLGPWRLNFAISRMEGEREDIDAPLFMAWRVTVMPFKDMELGFSRTAQFCGEQLVCSFDSFTDMLLGRDNLGFDATPETEPGNQMAGFDIRWSSPIGSWPYAVYGQMIGEDESGYLPAKYLAQFGLEAWRPLRDGGLVQVFTEYADTSCSAVSGSGPYNDCAYNQGLFNVEGYRYRGRVIGHSTDRDSRSLALGVDYTRIDGSVWSAVARVAEINRAGSPLDVTQPLTAVPADYSALELGWRGKWVGGDLGMELGVESFAPEGASRDTQAYGFLRWSRTFDR